jgi:hypothetical protein
MKNRLFGALLCAASGLLAQSITSSLVGTVHDDSGAVVPNATITAVNVATNARGEARSDATGSYTLLQLTPGSYTVEITAPGFKKYVRTGLILELQQQARLDATLSVGQLNETVSVTADAPLVDATTSTIGDVVNNHAILNLPLNTRNIYSLIYLTPGVAGSIGNDYNSLSYSVNGARSSSMETMVDGATGGFPTVNGFFGIGVFPSVDAISEFKMMDSNYSAEFGRSLGNVVNVIYKSGTNAYHGSAYEFLRNSALDANTFFSNARGVPLPSFKRHQFGGVFDGPIRKDKTFFLFSLEDLRQNAFQSTNPTVPTLLQRNGDFSQTFAANGQQIKIFNPFSTRANPAGGFIRDQFAGNVIPPSMINPVSRNLVKYYPLPNTTGNATTNANNYYNTGGHLNDIDSWDIRVDHNITEKQRIFGRYSDRFNNDLPASLFPHDAAIAEGVINQKNYMRNAVADYTYTLNPTTILSGRLGFSRALYYFLNEGLGFNVSSLGLPKDLDTAGYLPIFPLVTTNGYVTLGNQDNRRNAFMSYSALASLTKIKGSHTIKAGWEGRMIRVNNHEYRDTSGNYGFGTNFSQGPNPSTASSTAGNGFASMLLGTGSGDLIQNFKDVAAQSFYHGLYIQDDWRVNRRLTLNLGLRYDLDTPRTERYNRMNYFDPAVKSPLADVVPGFANLRGGLVFVGANGNGPYQYNWDRNNLAPRIGFAYQLNDKTVLRGGWGNVYGSSPQAAQGTVGPYGFRVQTSWVGSLDNITPYNLFSNPFPQGFAVPPGSAAGLVTGAGGVIQADLRNTVTPYTMQYNFNVQRQLPFDSLIEVGYVGNRGLQLQRNTESGLDLDQINPVFLSLGSHLNDLVSNPFFGIVNSGVLAAPQVSRAQLLRPYPQFTSVIPLFSSGSSSTYNSLQVRFSKRYAHGLQFEGSYVFSKVIDNGSNHQDSYNILADRAVTSYDIPHRFVIGYIYELPFGRGRHFGSSVPGAVNWILGGWQFNGITTLQSGTPLAISANNVSGLGNPTERANNNGQSAALTGDIHNRLNKYFETSDFSQPAAFTLGNTAAYISNLRTQYVNNWDLSLFKEFLPRENIHVQFRAEFLNAFNRVLFGGPNTSVTATTFGVITSQGNSPRQLQFGLKILF